MRKVTCSLGTSLDGYIEGPDGAFNWSVPDPELFRFATDEVRGLAVHLLGRRLWETMRYWATVDRAQLDEDELVFADLWNALPKVVFSTTLIDVSDDPSARLATGTVAEEIARLRAEPGDGNIGIGGPGLAAAAADLDLIDEYRVRVFPVLVGGGKPFFTHHGQRRDLALLEHRAFDHGVLFLHHAVVR